jgi:hypothetical protein
VVKFLEFIKYILAPLQHYGDANNEFDYHMRRGRK